MSRAVPAWGCWFDEAEYAKKVDLEYLGLLRNETSNQERVCVSEAGLEVVVPVQR